MRHSPDSRSGSVFFLILFGIFLFAALSYAVMQGSRMSQANLTSEQARVAANEIIAYGQAVQKTVQIMRLRGVAETQFDFSNSNYTTVGGSAITTANASCTSVACKVFDPSGGKLTPLIPQLNVTMDQTGWPVAYWKAGHVGFRTLQIANIGTSAAELVMVMPFLKKEVCIKINNILGVTNPADNPPLDPEGSHLNYSGNIVTFPDAGGFGIGDDAPEVVGKSVFCVTNGGADHYFYAVLLAR